MKRRYRAAWAVGFLLLVAAGVVGSIGVWQDPHTTARDQWTNQALILGLAGFIICLAVVIASDLDSDE